MLSEKPSLIEGIRNILLQLAEEEISLEENLGYVPAPEEALSHRFNSKLSAYQDKTSQEKDDILHAYKYLTQMELGDYDKDILFNHIRLLEEVFKFIELKDNELANERQAKEEAEARADGERKAREEAEKEAEKERKARELSNKRKKSSSIVPFSPLDTLSHNNTKLANNLFQGNMELDQLTLFNVLKPSKNRNEDELTTSCSLSSDFFDTGYLEFSSNPPSPYDREVYDAIASHFEAGNTQLTVAEIYRAMTGKVKGNNFKPSPQQAGAITKSIRRMGMLRVKIDCTNELKARGADIAHAKLDSIALEYRALEGESSNGKPFVIYDFKSEPILFTYAKAVKQIIPIPMKLLDTPTNNSEELLVIKKYLLARILNMTNSHNAIVQDTILLEHIYDQLGANNNNLKRKARNKIEPFFDYWISLGLFSKYEYVSKGQTLHSIKFSFPSNRKFLPSHEDESNI